MTSMTSMASIHQSSHVIHMFWRCALLHVVDMVGMVWQELPGDANSTAYASSRVHACDLLPSAAAGCFFAAKNCFCWLSPALQQVSPVLLRCHFPNYSSGVLSSDSAAYEISTVKSLAAFHELGGSYLPWKHHQEKDARYPPRGQAKNAWRCCDFEAWNHCMMLGHVM